MLYALDKGKPRTDTMRTLLAGLVALLCLLILGSCAGTDLLSQELDKVSDSVVRIRGLEPKSDIEKELVTSSDLRSVLYTEMEKEYPMDEAKIEQEVMELLDLIPAGTDLRETMLDLYSEQVVGFYLDTTKKLFVVSDKEEIGPVEKAIFAHEYTHALQDQHFDIASMLREENSDRSLAATCLAEGDALLVQTNYIWREFDRSEIGLLLEESREAETSKLDDAPDVIRETLLFPYQAGPSFVMSLGSWDAINEAYDDPPQSTEQIIHPEKYLEPDEPQTVTMPDLAGALGEGWSKKDEDTLGELNFRIYLETFLPQILAESAAAGWDGDRYQYVTSAGKDRALALRSVWDSEQDAHEFFDSYVTFMKIKNNGTRGMTNLGDKSVTWIGPELAVYVEQNGTEALLVLASTQDVMNRVVDAFSY